MSESDPLKLRVGDHVRIHPEWQDPGDDEFDRIVIESPADSPRALIRTIIPGFAHHPTEWIEADKLVRR